MADITMCQNKDCILSKTCYRFLAKPNTIQQAYAKFDSKKCTEYWPYGDKEHENKT